MDPSSTHDGVLAGPSCAGSRSDYGSQVSPSCHARRRVEPWFSSPQQTKGYGMLQPLSHGSMCLWESLASGGSPG